MAFRTEDNPATLDGYEEWLADTGANVVCVSPGDPAIVRTLYDRPPSKLGTSGGPISAQPTLIRTPFGVFEGLVASGSPRLFPAGLFEAFRRVKRVCLNGVCYDLCWRHKVPVLCGRDAGTPASKVGMTTLSLSANYTVSGRKRRKIARKLRRGAVLKRIKRHYEYEYEDAPSGGPGRSHEPPEARTPEMHSRQENEAEDSLSPEGDCSKAIDFSVLFAQTPAAKAYASRIKDPYLHLHCGCEFCRIAKAQRAPHLRAAEGQWSPELMPGDLIVGDLCTDWLASREGETTALVLKDVASGLTYVKALKSKTPDGVRAGLNEFRHLVLSFRDFLELPKPTRPWVFHTDRGGEFGGKSLAEYVAAQGGCMKLAPKGAHVSVAERTVRDVLQGTRVGLYHAGLAASFWPFASRQFVHNHNCQVNGFTQFMQALGKPHEKEVFGRLVYFKPDEDEKTPKGSTTSVPGCFLGYDVEMRRGIWAAFYRKDGRLGITTVDVGRTGNAIVWPEPGPDERPRMAFQRVTQDLRQITVPHKEDVLSGAPGMTTKELEAWVEANPPPRRHVDPASSCPACRGRNRAHTYTGTCLLSGLTEAQRAEYRVWARDKSAEEQKRKLASFRTANARAQRRVASEGEEAYVASRDVPSADREPPTCRVRSAGKSRLKLTVGPEFDDLESVDMCGNVGVSTCGCKYGACRSNYTRALEYTPGAGADASEPEPEPSFEHLHTAVLECGEAQQLEEICMAKSVSPMDFSRRFRSEPESEDALGVRAMAAVAGGADRLMAFVTRKMTAVERDGDGASAIITEVMKLVQYELYAPPREEEEVSRNVPGATVSGQVMLSHVKHAERPGHEVYKGRAVVLGDNIRVLATGQKASIPEGVEPGKVATLEEVRAVAAHATVTGGRLEVVDLESAYLTAAFEVPGRPDLELNHFLRLPKDMWKHFPDRLQPKRLRRPVWKMLRAGYGHELSGHIFIMKLKQWLVDHGFKKVEGSSALFTRGSIMLAVYVDDLLASGSDSDLDSFWKDLGAAFTFKAEPREVDEFLGMDFSRNDSDTHYERRIGMSAYILDTLREFEKLWGTKVRPSRTPGTECVRTYNKATSVPLKTARPVNDLQSIVGRLLWICRTARPELSHSASAFGARILTWDAGVDRELMKTMGYLALTHDAYLTFKWPKALEANAPGRVRSTIFTDADWMEPRSQSGFIAALSTGDDPDARDGFLPVHWGSKKQSLASDSSTAAEIIACHYGLRQGYPIMLALSEFLTRCKVFRDNPQLTIRVDNSTCLKHINKSYTETFFAYSKACAVRISLLSDLRVAGLIAASHVQSAINSADVFTKPFSADVFAGKAMQTGLVYPSPGIHRSGPKGGEQGFAARMIRGRWWRRRRSVWA